MIFFCNKYLIFILSFFSPMIINIGGEVSPSFLFIGATFPIWIKYLSFRKKTIFKYIVHLFVWLIIVQSIWAIFSDTNAIEQIKGILVIVSGLLHFMYYYMVYKYNPEVIKWAVLGTFLSSFVFVNVLVEIAGGEFGLWKFQIMPQLVTACLLIYLWGNRNKIVLRYAPLLFIFIGSVGLATGARSCGLVPFLAGGVTFLLQRKNSTPSKIKKYLLLGVGVLYIAYACIYVPNVLNGNITAGNTEQLKRLDNPYNPINLLMLGRVDSIIPFMAFLDEPLTGWGYHTKDPNYKYNRMQEKIITTNSDTIINSDYKYNAYIPGHSGWGYIACSYGILGFLIIFFILKKTLSILFHSFVAQDRYLLLRINIAIGFLWNLLFSPMAHLKDSPTDLAIIIVFSIYAIAECKKRIQLHRGI